MDKPQWKQAPTAPTVAMCIRGAHVVGDKIDGYEAATVYEAMLHVAPSADATGNGGVDPFIRDALDTMSKAAACNANYISVTFPSADWQRLVDAFATLAAPSLGIDAPEQQQVLQLAELLRGLEAGPAFATATPGQLFLLGKAIATQAKRVVQPPAEWLPIETAPKDGSMILLGRPAHGEGDDREDAICTPGYWQEGWDDSIDDMGCDDGFVDSQYQIFSPPRSFGAAAYRSAGTQPTHWMPQPAGPVHPAAQQGECDG